MKIHELLEGFVSKTGKELVEHGDQKGYEPWGSQDLKPGQKALKAKPMKGKEAGKMAKDTLGKAFSKDPKVKEGWGAETQKARHEEQMKATAQVLQKYKGDAFKSKVANYLFQNGWNAQSIDKELAGDVDTQRWEASIAKYEQNHKVKDWTDKMAQDYLSTEEATVAEEPASRALCTSGKPDSALGASQLASCKSQGYRSRDGGKSHKIGSERVKVRGKRIKGKKYGGPLPDWS